MTAVAVGIVLFLLVCICSLAGVLAWLLSNSAQAALKTNLAKFLAKKFGLALSGTDPTRADKRRYFWAGFIVIVSTACLVILFIFKEVILASMMYCAWVDAVSSATRLPPDAVNAITVILVSLFAFVFMPFALGAKSGTKNEQKRARLLFAALFVAMFFFAKHFVSKPAPDEYFNSVTGAPMWKYYVSDEGLIVQAPLYKKFNTQDGSLLKLMDPAVAKAHREQEKKRQATPPVQPQAGQGRTEEQPQPKGELRLPDAHSAQAKEIANSNGISKPFRAQPEWVSTNNGQDSNIDVCTNVPATLHLGNGQYGPFNLWVEAVNVTKRQTQVRVAVAIPNGLQSKSIFHSFNFGLMIPGWMTNREVAHLFDSDGYPYPLVSDRGPFNLGEVQDPYKRFLGLTMHPGERYHFLLSFPRLRTYWPDFELRVPHFPPITIRFVE